MRGYKRSRQTIKNFRQKIIAFLIMLIIALCLLPSSCLKLNQGTIFTPLPSSLTFTEAHAKLPTETQLPFTPAIPLQAATIRPTLTETIPPYLTPTIENTRKPTPTQLVDSYPHKEVWISYEYASGDHYEYEVFLGIRNFPKLILYTDGQLILFNQDKLPIQTKMLSPDEICDLFMKLETLGLSKIQTNGTGGLDDPIYQNTTGLEQFYDAGTTILYINGSVPRHYAVYDPYKDHAVKAILNIIAFLNQYTPNNLKPYHADRLSVFVREDRDTYLQAYPSLKDIKPIPWPADATPLSQNNEGRLTLTGKSASYIFDLTGGYPMENSGLFVDRGVEYLVVLKPILPDDWIGGYCYSAPCHKATPFIPPFSCK